MNQTIKIHARWAAFGVFASLLGYFALRQYNLFVTRGQGHTTARPMQKILDDLKDAFDKKSEDLFGKLKSSFFTKGVIDAFEVINNILGSLNDFGLSSGHYQSQRILLLGLIKKAQEERRITEKRSEAVAEEQPDPVVTQDELNFARHVGLYSINVYYASWLKDKKSIANALNIENSEDVLFTWFHDSGDDHCPKFALLKDTKIKSLIFVVRGTFSLADAISDIVCDEEPFLEGFAHRGILSGARKILKEIEPMLKSALEDNPDYDLILTGHSLGAGTAELITLSILNGKVDYIDPKSRVVKCLALAPPPVYRSDTKLARDIKSKIEIYINNNDCVPRLSLGVFAKLLAMMKAVDALKLTTYEQLMVLSNSKDPKVEEHLLKIIDAISTATQERFPFLEHPGRIFTLSRQDDLKLPPIIFKRPSRYFSNELLFLETMIVDHLHPSYKTAFDKISFTNPNGDEQKKE